MVKYTDYDVVFQEIPDEVTLAVNLSCCPNRCAGCHSPQLQGDIGEPLTERLLGDLLARYGGSISCLCFMGGDGDPQEVERLARWVATNGGGVCVGWYSGRDALPRGVDERAFRYIKLGGYRAECGSLRSRTTNQRLYKIAADGTRQDITAKFWR